MSGDEMSPEAEDWVVNVYAVALRCIADRLRQIGMPGKHAEDLAGIIIADLARLDPPLTVELLA